MKNLVLVALAFTSIISSAEIVCQNQKYLVTVYKDNTATLRRFQSVDANLRCVSGRRANHLLRCEQESIVEWGYRLDIYGSVNEPNLTGELTEVSSAEPQHLGTLKCVSATNSIELE